MSVLRFSHSLTLLILAVSFAFGQPLQVPAGSQSEVRKVIMDANNVTVVVYNYGQLTRPNTLSNVADFVWHQLGYMFEFGPLLSGEVTDSSGKVVRILDDGLWLQNQGGYSPDGMTKWGWLPRAGYARAGSTTIPTLRDTLSWPPSWISWPARDGMGSSSANNETYYVIDDFTNAKYPYFPFPQDSTKRGLGVSAQVWASQYSGGLQDAIIITWRLKNESPRPLAKCFFGFYGDPHVGGSVDFGDDLVSFIEPAGPAGDPLHFEARNTIYNFDTDGIGSGGRPTGYMNLKFLKTPDHRDLTALNALPYTNSIPNVPKNDTLFSRLLSADSIDRNQELFTTAGDNILVFGSGPFSLNPGDSTEFALAVFFSDSYADMLDDAAYVHYAWHWPSLTAMPGQSGGDPSCSIGITSPHSGKISGDVPITWNYTGTDQTAKVFLEYSSDGGNRWRYLASDLDPAGTFTWSTAAVRDGSRYLLRAVAYTPDFSKWAYGLSADYFTIDNPGNAQPEVVLYPPAEGSVLRHSPVEIGWEAWDADNTTLSVTLLDATSPAGPFTPIHSGSYPNGRGSFVWQLSGVPNAPNHSVKVTVSDGVAESTFVSKGFTIAQQAGIYPDSVFRHTAGRATPALALQVTDLAGLTGHRYEMTFSVPYPDSAKLLTVTDLTLGSAPLSGYRLQSGNSTPEFDGVKLTVTDKETDVDTLTSGFSRPELDTTIDFRWKSSYTYTRSKLPQTWRFVFNALDTLPNGHYLFPGDSGLNAAAKKVVVCPFRVLNVDSMAPARFHVRQNLPYDSTWQPSEPIFLMPQSGPGIMCYVVQFDFSSGLKPGAGDTLWVRTFKPISAEDVFQFSTENGYTLHVDGGEPPGSYALYPNYPNPFNPFTMIAFDLPRAEDVDVQLFDMLGREVASIVRGRIEAGHHQWSFDASSLSSGVYFCRMQAGSFIQVRKLLLIR